MTPRSRDNDEEDAFISKFVKQLEESWLRVAIGNLEKKTDGQHGRHGLEIAVVKRDLERIEDKYMSIDKFSDYVRLQDEKNKRFEDREKWIMLGMKWTALGGGIGAGIEIMLKVAGK